MRLAQTLLRTVLGDVADRRVFKEIMTRTSQEFLQGLPDSRFIGYRQGDAHRLMQHFEESNRSVARRYLRRPDGRLFHEDSCDELPEGAIEEGRLSWEEATLLCETVARHARACTAGKGIGELEICARHRSGSEPTNEQPLAVQLYLDRGRGFREEESLGLSCLASPGDTLVLRYAGADPLHGLRLDPATFPCLVSVTQARAVLSDGSSVPLQKMGSNATRIGDGRHLFCGDDPWIRFAVAGSVSHCEFTVIYHLLGPEAAALCSGHAARWHRGALALLGGGVHRSIAAWRAVRCAVTGRRKSGT